MDGEHKCPKCSGTLLLRYKLGDAIGKAFCRKCGYTGDVKLGDEKR